MVQSVVCGELKSNITPHHLWPLSSFSVPADYCLRDLVYLPVSHLWSSLMLQASRQHQWRKSLSLPPTTIPLTIQLHLLAVACCLHLPSSPSMVQLLQTILCSRVIRHHTSQAQVTWPATLGQAPCPPSPVHSYRGVTGNRSPPSVLTQQLHFHNKGTFLEHLHRYHDRVEVFRSYLCHLHSISMPPQSLSAHRPGYSIAGAAPVSAMPTQAPAPPPYQPALLYQPQQALVQQPLLWYPITNSWLLPHRQSHNIIVLTLELLIIHCIIIYYTAIVSVWSIIVYFVHLCVLYCSIPQSAHVTF